MVTSHGDFTKEVFDKAYIKVDDNTELPSGVSIGQKMVDEFIAYTETKTMGTKTTGDVHCVLRNGFEIVESTGCVDEKNYSEKIGYEICIGRINDKIWGTVRLPVTDGLEGNSVGGKK